MLFDVVFLGFPIALAVCLAGHALREQEIKFWRPAICLSAYCMFYLTGGREVLLYLVCGLIIGGAWLHVGPW